MPRVDTKQNRMTYPTGAGGVPVSGREISQLTAEQRAASQFAERASHIASLIGGEIIQEDNKVSAINAQIQLDTFDYESITNLSGRKYEKIEDFSAAQEEYIKNREGYVKSLLTGKNEDVAQSIELYAKGSQITSQANHFAELEKHKLKYAQTQFFINQQQITTHINPENIEQQKAAMLTNIESYKDFFTPAQINSFKQTVDNNLSEGLIENIKPDLIAVIAKRNSKEDGYAFLNAATEQLAKDGLLTKSEAAEANKTLGDWMDNYVSGRIKEAKETEKLTTKQTYQKLSKPILNGELTYDDIDNSPLQKTRRSGESVSDTERWHQYIKGSYKEAPTKNTPEGHNVAFNAVYDAATLQLSPKEAYDVLLEARFNDRTITNEQFEWAVDKIENPYPKHVLEDLKATIKSNHEDFNRVFSSDKERNKKVNESLISWVDDLIKQEKTPSKKEMFAMSSAFRAGGGQTYDIGQVIEQAGWEWEIVGFDEDGEPLVEEIGPLAEKP